MQPFSSARYVKMTSFLRPDQAKGQWDNPQYGPGLIPKGSPSQEAANELTLLATGIYGHELPDQHGAPIRLVVPWKYGFKGIKSIVRIEFTRKEARHVLDPGWRKHDYGFNSIVNPNVTSSATGHKRTERFLENATVGDTRRPTLLYNGYGDYVAHLYSASDLDATGVGRADTAGNPLSRCRFLGGQKGPEDEVVEA